MPVASGALSRERMACDASAGAHGMPSGSLGQKSATSKLSSSHAQRPSGFTMLASASTTLAERKRYSKTW